MTGAKHSISVLVLFIAAMTTTLDCKLGGTERGSQENAGTKVSTPIVAELPKHPPSARLQPVSPPMSDGCSSRLRRLDRQRNVRPAST
jgi:hypothetical protein